MTGATARWLLMPPLTGLVPGTVGLLAWSHLARPFTVWDENLLFYLAGGSSLLMCFWGYWLVGCLVAIALRGLPPRWLTGPLAALVAMGLLYEVEQSFFGDMKDHMCLTPLSY